MIRMSETKRSLIDSYGGAIGVVVVIVAFVSACIWTTAWFESRPLYTMVMQKGDYKAVVGTSYGETFCRDYIRSKNWAQTLASDGWAYSCVLQPKDIR